METKTLARITAVAFIGVAMTLAALQTQRVPTAPSATLAMPFDNKDTHDLSAELQRCQAIGANGANDARCLQAWAENRSRFFMSKLRANPRLREKLDTAPLGNESVETSNNANLGNELPAAPTFDTNR